MERRFRKENHTVASCSRKKREKTRKESGSLERDSEFLKLKGSHRVTAFLKHSTVISGHKLETGITTWRCRGILRDWLNILCPTQAEHLYRGNNNCYEINSKRIRCLIDWGVEPTGNTLQMVGNLAKGRSYSSQNRHDADLTDFFLLLNKDGILILELLPMV